MSLASVRAFLAEKAPDIVILETAASTATVEEAAAGHGVTPGQIAKTLSLKLGEKRFLLVTSGGRRLDNRKMKQAFGGKVSMLSPEEALELTGHPVGGVCPFGLANPLEVYCDISLKAYGEVLPAAGSTNSALRINPLRMAEICAAQWVDVCHDATGD